jgi:peptide/nickel transport system permease protein
MLNVGEVSGAGLVAAPPRRSRASARRFPLATYLLRRLGYSALMLLAISVLVFFFTQALPGNVARQILGQNATAAQVSRLRAQLGINQSLASQYLQWLHHIATLNLGTSLTSGTPVTTLIAGRAANSAVLVGATAAVLIPSVLILGILAARHPGGLVDSIVSGAVLFVLALPEFIIAILLIIFLASNVLHVEPPTSVVNPQASLWSQRDLFVLPVLALVVGSLPYLTESVKTVVREELGSEHVAWARLSGISEARLLWRHALPNAIGPSLQVSGTTLVYLTGGIVAVENVFAFPGIGAALTAAVANRDIPVVQAIAMLLAAVALAIYLLADVLHILLSPRLRTALR